MARVAPEQTWDSAARRQAFRQTQSALRGVSHVLADFDTPVFSNPFGTSDKCAPHTAEAATCKWCGPKLVYGVLRQCLLMFGQRGYDHDLIQQRLRDVLGCQIGDGTAHIMKTVVVRTRAGSAAVPA